jgi:EAL domain-containing protein (putative c-di-GMP-specific phosphodiesterase class I)
MGVGRLRAALKSGRLLLFARPMSSSANAPPAARYQVTLRMRDEEGAIVAPDGLLGGAERYRLLPGIDRWAVEGVLRLLVPHRTLIAARGVGIWIGVAAQSVADPDFLGQSCALLREAALPRGCLTIEFPEQAALEHFAQSKRFVEQLKTFGCRFALGGFRMDRDALMHIRQLEISGLKLAPGLAPAAIRSIVEFANSLPVETIAGSLDVPDAVGGMRRLGIGHLAGDAIGLPEPLEATLGGLGEDESRRLNRLHLEM